MQVIDAQPYRQDDRTVATLPPDAHGVPVHQAPSSWRPTSWRNYPAPQQPDWPDQSALERVVSEISRLPSLVRPGEIRGLQRSLAEVASGRAFLLQGGDCAERFESCTEQGIRGKLQVILQLAILLTYGSGLPVV
jgi:3-deoxy-7-phosphoheptulonate synthase